MVPEDSPRPGGLGTADLLRNPHLRKKGVVPGNLRADAPLGWEPCPRPWGVRVWEENGLARGSA